MPRIPPQRLYGFLNIGNLVESIEAAPETVYAVWDGEYLKIGKSRAHPQVRLRDLQVANARPLTLLAWTVTCTERQAHRKLAPCRIRGEWFRIDERVHQELARWTWLNEGAYHGLTLATQCPG
jgi:hypothetical protein